MPAVLFVLTSANKNLLGGPAVRFLASFPAWVQLTIYQGWYLPEAAHPYYILAPHASVDFASPAGPNPPLDPRSVEVSIRSWRSHQFGFTE